MCNEENVPWKYKGIETLKIAATAIVSTKVNRKTFRVMNFLSRAPETEEEREKERENFNWPRCP